MISILEGVIVYFEFVIIIMNPINFKEYFVQQTVKYAKQRDDDFRKMETFYLENTLECANSKAPGAIKCEKRISRTNATVDDCETCNKPLCNSCDKDINDNPNTKSGGECDYCHKGHLICSHCYELRYTFCESCGRNPDERMHCGNPHDWTCNVCSSRRYNKPPSKCLVFDESFS
jgi:hypothetical protein